MCSPAMSYERVTVTTGERGSAKPLVDQETGTVAQDCTLRVERLVTSMIFN